MIVRSYTRRTSSFHQLFHYLTKDGRAEASLPVGFNLFSPGIPDPDAPAGAPGQLDPAYREIADEFRKNAHLLPPRKNGVVLYHEILSLAKADRTKITPAILTDFAAFYVSRRAPGALACAVIHTDRDHAHIHLVISANLRGQPQRIRLSRAEFCEAKKALEAYQRERYPELTHSRVDHDPPPEHQRKQRAASKTPRLTHNEHQRRKRLKREGRDEPSRKELLRQHLLTALTGSLSPEHFQSRLLLNGIHVYERNAKPAGIIHNGKKYRFKTLGLHEAMETARHRWRQLPKRQIALKDLLAEKARQRLRNLGFPERIRDVLESGEQTERGGDSLRKSPIRHRLKTKHRIHRTGGMERG